MADRFVTETGCTVKVHRLYWKPDCIVLSYTMEDPKDGRHSEVMLTQDEWEQLKVLEPSDA